MINKSSRKELKHKRHFRIRNKVEGTELKPRLTVFKSLKYIYVQIIDDANGVTLAQASSLEKELKDKAANNKGMEAAKLVGELIAKRALDKNIKEVVFDRSGYIYHGKVKALADSARSGGLTF